MHSFNLLFQRRMFPDDLKILWVDQGIYRLISVYYTFAKLFEKFVFDQFCYFLAISNANKSLVFVQCIQLKPRV